MPKNSRSLMSAPRDLRSNPVTARRRTVAGLVLGAVTVATLPFVAFAQDDAVTTTTVGARPAAPEPTPTTPTTTTTTTTVPAVTTPTVTTPAVTTPPVTVPTVTTPDVVTPGTNGRATTTTVATTSSTVPTPTTTVAPTPAAPRPAGPAAPPQRNITAYPEQLQHILATIRYQESRGIYDIPPNRGNASGAYQFIASTWNDYGGYPHAYLAPPAVQDERAAKDVLRFLAQWDMDVSMVPVMWYYPRAAREPALMDVVPVPSAGNVLTIREYQTRWLGVFAFISGQPIESFLDEQTAREQDGEPPLVPDAVDGVPAIAFPVLGPSRVAVPECDDVEGLEATDLDGDRSLDGPSRADVEAAGLCTEQAPGIVFGVKLQPVTVVADGIVTDVVDEPGTDTPISVTVTDESGISYVYAGFNDDNPGTDDGAAPAHLRLSALAEVGRIVRAGQIIGFMGDTDPLPVGVRADVPTDATVVIDSEAVAPHVRITMIDIDGRPIDAFGPLIDALYRQTCGITIGQWSIPANGSGHEPVTIETTDDDTSIDSEWVITSTGQVTASGWASMINPNEGCGYTPSTPHGPGADGSELGLVHWFTPVELPTRVWVALALQDEVTSPGGLLRPG